MKTMRLFLVLLIVFVIGAIASAQSSPVSVSVGVSCSSISVSLSSSYARAIKAQVYAGTNGLTEWNLVGDIGNYTTANANSSGSKTYTFPAQRANTVIFYSVRVYDDVSNNLLVTSEGSRDCDGAANNNPSPTATQTPTTGSSSVAFLAACNSSGGITIQVIGGTNFSVTAAQIAQGIANANATHQNSLITSSSGISVTALTNNSVQITASNGYSITVPATACSTTGGSSGGGATVGCNNTPADARAVHVVQAGENLFRIGLRYGVSYTRLAAYNGIPDPTVIYVGQCIAIPPA